MSEQTLVLSREIANPGSFYKGQPQCAFYAESAERSDHESLSAFSRLVTSGDFRDDVAAEAKRHTCQKARCWKLGYARGEQSLGLSVDLMQWKLLRRWNETGDIVYPLLESAVARQSARGIIQVDGARLHAGDAKLWLYGKRESDLWVAGGIANQPTHLVLEFPDRSLRIEQFRYGTIKVLAGRVELDTNPQVTAEFC